MFLLRISLIENNHLTIYWKDKDAYTKIGLWKCTHNATNNWTTASKVVLPTTHHVMHFISIQMIIWYFYFRYLVLQSWLTVVIQHGKSWRRSFTRLFLNFQQISKKCFYFTNIHQVCCFFLVVIFHFFVCFD